MKTSLVGRIDPKKAKIYSRTYFKRLRVNWSKWLQEFCKIGFDKVLRVTRLSYTVDWEKKTNKTEAIPPVQRL